MSISEWFMVFIAAFSGAMFGSMIIWNALIRHGELDDDEEKSKHEF